MKVSAIQRMLGAKRAGFSDDRKMLMSMRTRNRHTRLDFREQAKAFDPNRTEHGTRGLATGDDQAAEMPKARSDECRERRGQLSAFGRIKRVVAANSRQQIGAASEVSGNAALPRCPLRVERAIAQH